MHRLASPFLAAVIAVGGLLAPSSPVARASALVSPDVLLRAPAAGHGTTVNAPRFAVATGNVASWYSSGVVGGLTCGGVWEEFGAASSMYERRVAVGNPYGTGCVALREDYSAGTSRVVLGTDVASGDVALAFGQSLASN
ncbi:MAG: hypothetical protein EBR48_04495, partial [bacterium]|nr:hypothetical protein [Candidatus Aquidulcis frankliniae]